MAFPSVTLELVDDFDRSDGALSAGAGASLWDASLAYDGSAVDMVVAGNAMAAANTAGKCLGVLEMPRNFEASIDVPTHASGYAAWFWGMVDGGTAGWEAYWLLADGAAWQVNKRVGGATTEVEDNNSAPVLASGDKIGVRKLDETIEVFHYTAGAWNQTPIITGTVDPAFDGAGVFAFDLQNTTWRLDNLRVGELVGLEGAATLYVNADHEDASDDLLRSQVGVDLPLATVGRAMMLAQASAAEDWADEIVVFAAEAADPGNTVDPAVYAAVSHNEGAAFLPFGDNSANPTIVVRGVTAEDTVPTSDAERPRWLGFSAQRLKNWRFEHLHFGYEFDSGDDALTIREIEECDSITWSNCMWTGGAYLIRNCTTELVFEDCEITAKISPFLGSGGRVLDGVGVKIVNSSQAGEDFPCHFEFTRCHIHDVEGEDGFQVGTGAPDQVGTSVTWTECTFEDIKQLGEDGGLENPEGIHTDCVQILGGPAYYFYRCKFERFTTGIMASDYRNGLIHIENCLFAGAALEEDVDAGIAITIQGTDDVVLINNTAVFSGFGVGLKLMFRYEPLTAQTNLTLINNIFDGLYQQHDTIVYGSVERKNNLIGSVTGFTELGEDELEGFTEFGTSEDTILELASIPIASPAKDAGLDDPRVPETDRLGRARDGSAPDIGCHESPDGITANPRPPFVVDLSPEGAGAARDTDVTARLYPVPGQTIDAATVTTSSAWVTDSAGETIPAVVSLGAPDEDGYQVLTIELLAQVAPDQVEGLLDPLVSFTARLAGTIEDTQGSAINALTWNFTTEGRDGPAITTVGGEEVEATVFTMSGAPWSVGAVVAVYPERAFPVGAAMPSGSTVTTGTVSSSSAVTFSGLAQGVRYVAFAEGRAVRFLVPTPTYRTVRVQ